tara:strand:- start:1136 stop:1273 length:138 start_codon:yes stop_codon:yes gene_type:complete
MDENTSCDVYERCKNCDMPLEDPEVCGFCHWKQIDHVIEEGEKDD